jgi:Zn-dependent protease with chaperone function
MNGVTVAIWIPLLVPLLAAPLARLLATRLPPRLACWLLAGSGAVLSVCATLALGLLAGAGLLRLSFVAALGDLPSALLRRMSPTPLPLGCAAAVALVATVGLAAWRLHRLLGDLALARRAAPIRPSALSVLADDLPDAYAVPGRAGFVVVTTGMLRMLNAREREALLAHERAHLTGRHHWFTLVMNVAATLHPALIALCAPLRYQLERWADESAADAVGDRRLVARTVARAALMRSRAGRENEPRRGVLSSATTGPVPRRVAALLADPPVQRSRLVPCAVALATCLAISWAGTLDAATDLHASVEAVETHRPPGIAGTAPVGGHA